MKNQPVFTTEAVFPIIVILFSIFNISSHLSDIVSFSVLVSLLGIVGAALFFLKHSIAPKIIYAWIILQIVVVEPNFNLTQGLTFYFFLGIDNHSININVVALLMLGAARILATAGLAGKMVTVYQFRESELGNVFPVTGTLIKRVKLEGEKNWLLAHLTNPVTYNNKPVYYVLIRRKDGKTLKLSKEKQICFLRLVVEETNLDNTTDAKRFPFIEWVYVAK